jgi:CheY-like chemotaxis protein
MKRPGDGAMVLVVDDERDIRDAAVMLLRSDGYTAAATENGREALGLLRSGAIHPRLIILDLRMPVMDGFAFREASRRDPRLADIPVMVVSASDVTALRGLAELGVAAVLPKPFELERFVAEVHRLC